MELRTLGGPKSSLAHRFKSTQGSGSQVPKSSASLEDTVLPLMKYWKLDEKARKFLVLIVFFFPKFILSCASISFCCCIPFMIVPGILLCHLSQQSGYKLVFCRYINIHIHTPFTLHICCLLKKFPQSIA